MAKIRSLSNESIFERSNTDKTSLTVCKKRVLPFYFTKHTFLFAKVADIFRNNIAALMFYAYKHHLRGNKRTVQGTVHAFKRMASYIDQSGYEICGNAYEEYPINEVGIIDDSRYLLRVMVEVRKKKKSKY